MTARPLRSVYQLKVTLKYFRPPIWRRFLIASSANLSEVHITLQIVMGWTNSHLHGFIFGNEQYGEPDQEFFDTIKDESKFRLDQLLRHENEKLIYNYDYGDSWEHEVLLEKILPFKHDMTLPQCIKGKRACPPEDIGGIPGYALFLEAINDPSHPEHEEMHEWINGDFDAEHFDIHAINSMLNQYTKR
ncbi:MAG: plasmid pRiA4b ORF-3 family protein [Nitrosomonas sp.]|nr:plasmid pRiA4b ORF-3 family protein [Nitrosomonas sp.]